MRGTTALVAGMVLTLSLAGCGQDSVEESSAELCGSIAELESGVAEFRSMLESGATRDELTIQLNTISAETKNVVLDAKESRSPSSRSCRRPAKPSSRMLTSSWMSP